MTTPAPRSAERQVLIDRKPSVRQQNADVILVVVEYGIHHPSKYVTWLEDKETGTRYWGHYFETIQGAVADYANRK